MNATPAPRTFRYRSENGGYAVASAGTEYHDVIDLGRAVKIDGSWTAIAPNGTALAEQYRTRVEAADALRAAHDEEQAPTFAAAYIAPKVESVEPIENRLHIDPSEFSEGGTCTTCELPSHTTCPLVTGCECCEANAEEQIAEDAEPEFVKVQTTDGYGTPHMVLRRADLAAAGRAANASEDVNENASEEEHLAMLEEEYDALREEQDGNTPGTPRAAWVADRLNLLAEHMRLSAARIEAARTTTALTTGDAILVDGLLDEPTDTGDRPRHLMSADLLPACGGNDAPGDTVVDPVLDRVTCEPCRATVAERDLAPTPEQRYEVQGDTTAADLRPGDVVVDHEGARQYAAFDVDPSVPGASQTVLVWTAIADQERGLSPVLRLPADLRVRITRVAAHA